MTTKACFKCKRRQPLDEFYRHSMMADGHLNKCKTCTRADVSANRAAKSGYYKAYDRVRYYDQGSRGTKTSAEVHRKAAAAWRERNRDKRAAHVLLGTAIKLGKVKRPRACSRCRRRGPVQAHHADYTKPLEVAWICSKCHGREHRLDELEARERLALGPKG